MFPSDVYLTPRCASAFQRPGDLDHDLKGFLLFGCYFFPSGFYKLRVMPIKIPADLLEETDKLALKPTQSGSESCFNQSSRRWRETDEQNNGAEAGPEIGADVHGQWLPRTGHVAAARIPTT